MSRPRQRNLVEPGWWRVLPRGRLPQPSEVARWRARQAHASGFSPRARLARGAAHRGLGRPFAGQPRGRPSRPAVRDRRQEGRQGLRFRCAGPPARRGRRAARPGARRRCRARHRRPGAVRHTPRREDDAGGPLRVLAGRQHARRRRPLGGLRHRHLHAPGAHDQSQGAPRAAPGERDAAGQPDLVRLHQHPGEVLRERRAPGLHRHAGHRLRAAGNQDGPAGLRQLRDRRACRAARESTHGKAQLRKPSEKVRNCWSMLSRKR